MPPPEAGAAPAQGPGRLPSGVVLVWLLLTALTNLPYLQAALDPPPRMRFVGFFFFVDDAYHYLSYVQQAADGAFLFRSKLYPGEHAPQLVNLEWWGVGRLSAALGGHPLVAYRLFGAGANLALVAAAAWWLRRCAVSSRHLFAALLLVVMGGGLGGVRFLLGLGDRAQLWRHLDLGTGLFPFVEALTNPHFVAGTALLLWALAASARALETGSRRAYVAALLLGNVLALTRPYDFVLLAGVVLVAALMTRRPRQALVCLLPFGGFLPVAAYSFWVFYLSPVFGTFTATALPTAGLPDLAWAIGPAALALLINARQLRPLCRSGQALPLALWIAFALLVVVARPVHFSLQFIVGLGAPLLILVAAAQARARPRWLLALALLLAPTAAVALRLTLSRSHQHFVPSPYLAAIDVLERSCRPNERVFAPSGLGLMIIGLTRCNAYVSHQYQPDYAARQEAVARFYSPVPVSERSALLERERIAHVILPGAPGPVPYQWLGSDTAFRLLSVVGQPPATLSLYRREARPAAP